jgi:anoctamin-8
VEFWKRKTCEINARWGTLDMMNEDEDQTVREGFSGDEEIFLVTGELTKHERKFETVVVLLISVPILLVLTSCAIVIFFAID